jgi:hypothetical protein
MQQKSGSVFCDVEVPDFTKSALTLSGVVLSVTPGVAVAPKDFAPILTLPTAFVEFALETHEDAHHAREALGGRW